MRTAYIGYNKRSCVTGRQLFETLNDRAVDAANDVKIKWRHTVSNPKKPTGISHLLRWGNSYTTPIEGAVELNSQEAVARATDKLEMIRTLDKVVGVSLPMVMWADEARDHLNSTTSRWFVRDANDHIRNRLNWISGDKYAIEAIDKAREFRVHVFNGKVLGIYEKIPSEAMTQMAILKDANSQFLRLDMANTTMRSAVKGVRPMAKAAVAGLGLLFGGVDVIVARNGNIYVLEVNSAPALNTENLERWSDAILSYINGDNGQPTETLEPEVVTLSRDQKMEVLAARLTRAASNTFHGLPIGVQDSILNGMAIMNIGRTERSVPLEDYLLSIHEAVNSVENSVRVTSLTNTDNELGLSVSSQVVDLPVINVNELYI